MISQRALRQAAIMCIGLALPPQLVAAERVYSIRVYSSQDASQAQRVLTEQTAAGWSAQLRSERVDGGDRETVCLGLFHVYAEAWAVKKRLNTSDYPDTSIISWDESSPISGEVKLPIDWPFDADDLEVLTTMTTNSPGDSKTKSPAGSQEIHELYQSAEIAPSGDVTPEVLAKIPSEMSKDELWLVGRDAPKNSEGIPALERFLEQYPNDAKASAARLRLARRLMARKDSWNTIDTLLKAVQSSGSPIQQSIAAYLSAYASMKNPDPGVDSVRAFEQVASDSSMPRSLRLDAMRRAAGLAHAKRDYPTAWLAFSQLEAVSADPLVTAEARMQKVGLAFELAASAKGSWEEVRTLGDAALSSPGISKELRATTRLMMLESYLNEGLPQQCLDLTDSYLREFGDIKREGTEARVCRGLALRLLNRYGEAKDALWETVNSTLKPAEKFAKSEPQAEALYYLATIYYEEGNREMLQTCADKSTRDFPGNSFSKKLAKLASGEPFQRPTAAERPERNFDPNQ